MNPLEAIMLWAENNIFILAMLGLVAFFGYNYLRIKRSSITKPINRSEIERQEFIKRMLPNKDGEKWLYRGKNNLGKIILSKVGTIKGNPIDLTIKECVVKPPLFWKITNPFAKEKIFQINQKEALFDNDKYVIPNWISFDYYFGVYYDLTIPKEHMEIIKNDNLIRTDLNELASIYYCKSQEQSTFDPIRAHQMALEEKRIELELAKSKSKAESV
jgi:hypothetical protein